MLAAFVETVDGPVVEAVPVAVPVGLRLVLNPVELLEDPVAVAVEDPVAVAFDPDPPMPLGERPEPELAMTPPVAAVD